VSEEIVMPNTHERRPIRPVGKGSPSDRIVEIDNDVRTLVGSCGSQLTDRIAELKEPGSIEGKGARSRDPFSQSTDATDGAGKPNGLHPNAGREVLREWAPFVAADEDPRDLMPCLSPAIGKSDRLGQMPPPLTLHDEERPERSFPHLPFSEKEACTGLTSGSSS
jgi:hypothetical protein